jgi:hypothetical protein
MYKWGRHRMKVRSSCELAPRKSRGKHRCRARWDLFYRNIPPTMLFPRLRTYYVQDNAYMTWTEVNKSYSNRTRWAIQLLYYLIHILCLKLFRGVILFFNNLIFLKKIILIPFWSELVLFILFFNIMTHYLYFFYFNFT